MGDYYEEDPNAGWNAGFEADPATTAYQLAQAAIAEHEAQNQRGFDEQRVAEQAASILAQAQAQQAAVQANEQVARTVDRSMVAHYGQRYADLAAQVGSRLAGDPEFATVNHQDPAAVLAYVDRTFNTVASESDPGVQEWQRIKAAGPGSYHDARSIDDALGRS